MTNGQAHIRFESVTVGYGDRLVQRDLDFTIGRGDIFAIMGPSGCGKSTLMRSAIGLLRPFTGRILYGEESFWDVDPERQKILMRAFGVMYQGGALWSSMSLAENIALPLKEFMELQDEPAREIASLKLALVGLAGFEDYYPSEISGGMRKRAALARAMALDPEILFFDEPSAGLDPISARLLDDLILQLRDSLGATVVVVTHDLASIFAIGDNSVFLDADSRTMIAGGRPKTLLAESEDPKIRKFLTRGEES